MLPFWRRFLVVLIALVILGASIPYILSRNGYYFPIISKTVLQPRITRPAGMAPAAFDAFLRACNNAKIQPYRIGQTLGNHPRSAGYHKRDGTLIYKGQRIDYSAAVDIATQDLNRQQINRFLETMGAQGFAAFYREGPRWRGGEHIHAIYAPLKMKWQLQRQVREWESDRRQAGKKAFKWQRKWRKNWRN